MFTLNITGTSPLMMSNIQLGDPDNEYVRDISRLNALKGKITDDQRKERDYLKWRGALYFDEVNGPIMPAANVFRSVQQAAALTRNGKDIERSLIMAQPCAPLEYTGPRTIEGLWKGGQGLHVDRRMGMINRAPAVLVRPIFPDWTCTFEFDLDEDILSLDDFTYLAEKAGRLIHLGTYRRFFGAYSVEVTK